MLTDDAVFWAEKRGRECRVADPGIRADATLMSMCAFEMCAFEAR